MTYSSDQLGYIEALLSAVANAPKEGWNGWDMDCDCGALHIYWGSETDARVELPADDAGDFRPAIASLIGRLEGILEELNAQEANQ